MKKYILFLITLIIFSNISYASFPVTSNTQIEVVEEVNPRISTSAFSNPIWGILSISFAILSLLLYITGIEGWFLAWVIGILAVIFGAIGFSRKLKELAIIGFILGCLETLFLIVVAILWIAAWS